ncbi:Serine protease snake [Ooceraea biroi]|nr:Serine protease snake [Ooceraea biroi]
MESNLSSSILIVLLTNFFTLCLLMQDELYEGSYCKLEDGKTGECKKIQDCPSRLQEVLEGRRSSDSKGRCGFENFTEIVCCPFNITHKIGLRPAEIACRQYENEIRRESEEDARIVVQEDKVQFNIFGGTEAERGEFPYMVALGYENQDEDDDNNTETIKYNCGGTLISSQYVLTAAHCVNNIQEKVPVEVRVGSEDLRSVGDAQRIPISNVITHPRYKRSVNYNDVAILKLRKPVRMDNNVRPICMQTKSLTSMDITPNISLVVIGWGATTFAEESTVRLMKTPSLSLVDRETCGKSFKDFNQLPSGLDESMLCMLDTNETRRADACHGDSGGPLLMLSGANQTIVGITAFGQACGGPIPGVYTAIHSYLEWIEKQVWPEMTDER